MKQQMINKQLLKIANLIGNHKTQCQTCGALIKKKDAHYHAEYLTQCGHCIGLLTTEDDPDLASWDDIKMMEAETYDQ